MKRIMFLAVMMFVLSFAIQAQNENDTMYVMKGGLVVGKYNVNNQVDSIIFYQPHPITVTDFDGNVYHAVTIGAQVWMAENLKTTHYSNGTAIPLVEADSSWDTLTVNSKAYCWYNNDIANKAIYGALYTWATTMNGAASETTNPSGVQGVCPTGWHLPSFAEWEQLIMYLGGNDLACSKLQDTTNWLFYPFCRATNETGFSALPCGLRHDEGTFNSMGYYGFWWSATKGEAENARYFDMSYFNSCTAGYSNMEFGYSVRCVKD